MTKYVSIIGNGESRRGFDISPLKSFSTVIGCNAIFRGFSAGANLAAAAKLLQRTHKGETIAIIICDSGLKYLSTDLWS